jgi:hypothetical protein
MNDDDAPWLIEENQSPLLQNVDIDDIGQTSRRGGVADFGSHDTGPHGLWRAFDAVLGQEALFSIYNREIHITSAQGVINQRACGVSMTDTLHQAWPARYLGRQATFINTAQVADSNASLASLLTVITDDNQFTQNVSMAPHCSVWWQNRLWVADNPHELTEETLWWSELEDGLSYSNFNAALIESGVGGRITALQPIRAQTAPQMLVFKERAIAVVETYWGSSSSLIPIAADALDPIRSSIKLITANAGCVATNSVQFTPGAPGGDVYFLSLDGIRAISRAQDDTLSGAGIPLSQPIQDTIDRINFEHADKAVSAVHKDAYYLAVPLDGAVENTHILQFNMRKPGWRVHTWAAKALAVTRLNQQQDQLWMQYNSITFDSSTTAAASGYHLFQTFTNLNDVNSVPVIPQIVSRAFIGNNLNLKKRWDHVSVFFRNDASETMTIALEYNLNNSSWITFASMVAGGELGDGVVLGETPLPWGIRTGLFRRMKFSLSDINPGYTLQLRMTGQSDLSQPVFYNFGLVAEMLNDTFDNETT